MGENHGGQQGRLFPMTAIMTVSPLESKSSVPLSVLHEDPLIGVATLNRDLWIERVNARWLELHAGGSRLCGDGTPLSTLFDPPQAAEWQRLIERALCENGPLGLLAIRAGRRVQSTVRPLERDAVIVLTVAGECEPAEPAPFEVVESAVVDLGELDRLTRRELEVLALIGRGLGRERIAAALYRSPKTVDNHMAAILAKLGAGGRADLIKHASRAGLRLEHAALPRTGSRRGMSA